ncbi:hypothetical protein TRAPUB_6492 [Trametes pubescens]|uniref:Uncharacterized protein n=1 Tax=Trametes pubescens TaxID=154538 RepID=A0A1M2V5U1_TRAPU|nr:hypothetical protein TRAPUB_6492 [Trametes pubescens]
MAARRGKTARHNIWASNRMLGHIVPAQSQRCVAATAPASNLAPQTGPHSDAVRQTRCKLWLAQIPLFLSPEALARFLGVFRRGDAVIHKEKNYKDQIQGINNDRHVRSDLHWGTSRKSQGVFGLDGSAAPSRTGGEPSGSADVLAGFSIRVALAHRSGGRENRCGGRDDDF